MSPKFITVPIRKRFRSARLWSGGFGLQRYAKSDGDRNLGACLLDLAARFQPQNTEKRDAMALLNLLDADTRWQDVTEIPDLPDLVAGYAPDGSESSAPGIGGAPTPEPFAFKSTRAIAPAKRPLGVATALESFVKIQELASRMSAAEMIANRHIQDRLRESVTAVPGHLSARCRLAAGMGRPASTLSLAGSITQLRTVERPLNALIRQRLDPSSDAAAPDLAEASALFSKAEFDLRKLRPILHAGAHPFSDSLVELLDDLRVQIRADAARSAVFLQQALDNLKFQVAQFTDDE